MTNKAVQESLSIFGVFGRWFLAKFIAALNYISFLGLIIRNMFTYRRNGVLLRRRIIVEQVYFTGVQAIELITIISFLAGALLVLYAIDELTRFGSLDSLNQIILATIVRQTGPMLTAIIVILRSGSALALEVGYMNVLREIEGIQMQGIPPIHMICVPRLLGGIIAVTCLMVYADIIAVIAGAFTGWFLEGMTPYHYFYSLSVAFRKIDFVIILTKGLCFGSIIPVVCLYNGLQARVAVTDIPPRVSRALVDCLMYCVISNILLTIVFSL